MSEMTEPHNDRWRLTSHKHRYVNKDGRLVEYVHSHTDARPHPVDHPKIIAIPVRI